MVAVGMMKLIEERDRKLAERGIFTVEQEIAGQISSWWLHGDNMVTWGWFNYYSEIEERNKELLDKINEDRKNKIEKVEVYKPDEFDDFPNKEEKTKGQEFAEHLKRQFAALDDEAATAEDFIAIQDFNNSNDEVKEVSVESHPEKSDLIQEFDNEKKAIEEDKTNESWELIGSETLGDSTSDISNLINDDDDDDENDVVWEVSVVWTLFEGW